MSPSKTAPPKPVTPESVKGLMVVEAVVLGFLSFCAASEYVYDKNLQQYTNNVVGSHATTYAIIIGLTVGLGGTVIAFRFWKNLQEAKSRLERASTPRLKGGVRHALSALPIMDEESPSDQPANATATPESPSGQAQPVTPVEHADEKPSPASSTATYPAKPESSRPAE